MQGVSKQQILELATCQFVEQPADVVIAGPIGTGKSHLAIALGVEAAKRRFRVLFVKAPTWSDNSWKPGMIANSVVSSSGCAG